MELDTKLTLHIPYYTWQGKLVENSHEEFRRRLLQELSSIGADSLYSTPAAGLYKGRAYAEELLTVFCRREEKERIIALFCSAFRRDNALLGQEAFAYECSGRLFIEKLA